MLKKYTVIWKIDVDAEDKVEAAKLARDIQLDRDSTATLFDVYQDDIRDAEQIDVDLF